MHTTSELLTALGQRLGRAGVLPLVLLAVALVVALGLTGALADDLFTAGADPVQVAPFRWFSRA